MASRTVMRAPLRMGKIDASSGASREMAVMASTDAGSISNSPKVAPKVEISQKEVA